MAMTKDETTWQEIEQDIKGFLEVNPTGNLNDLFAFYDTAFRSKYYRLKPDDYKYPNAGRKVINKEKPVKAPSPEPIEKLPEAAQIAKINSLMEIAKMINGV